MSEAVVVRKPFSDGPSHRVNHGIASEQLTPGHFLEPGGSDDVQKHATANGNKTRMVCLKDNKEGGLSDNIPSGDSARWILALPGTRIQALLHNSSTNLAVGDFVESNGDGNIVELGTNSSSGDDEPVFGFVPPGEAKNSPGSGTTRATIELL